MCREGKELRILIRDNGKGMERHKLELIRRGIFGESDAASHIGMENAITRLQMYYGDDVKIEINSTEGLGTEVILRIPT